MHEGSLFACRSSQPSLLALETGAALVVRVERLRVVVLMQVERLLVVVLVEL